VFFFLYRNGVTWAASCCNLRFLHLYETLDGAALSPAQLVNKFWSAN